MSTILIVDDDLFLLDMYATKFTEAGHTVDTAHSVDDALIKLREGAVYDIILLDMIMPRLTGLDLLKAIHAESLSKNPLCIVLSNQGEVTDIEEAERLGADGYIIKANLIPSEVVRTVAEYAEKRQKNHNA